MFSVMLLVLATMARPWVAASGTVTLPPLMFTSQALFFSLLMATDWRLVSFGSLSMVPLSSVNFAPAPLR